MLTLMQERRKRNRSIRVSSLEQLGPRTRLELPLRLQGGMQSPPQAVPSRTSALAPGSLLDWPPAFGTPPGQVSRLLAPQTVFCKAACSRLHKQCPPGCLHLLLARCWTVRLSLASLLARFAACSLSDLLCAAQHDANAALTHAGISAPSAQQRRPILM